MKQIANLPYLIFYFFFKACQSHGEVHSCIQQTFKIHKIRIRGSRSVPMVITSFGSDRQNLPYLKLRHVVFLLLKCVVSSCQSLKRLLQNSESGKGFKRIFKLFAINHWIAKDKFIPKTDSLQKNQKNPKSLQELPNLLSLQVSLTAVGVCDQKQKAQIWPAWKAHQENKER